ncbi:MAG: transposase [Thermoleophilia bacterium]|nr:transposase [Thermoleophilia bacterium]
MRDISLTEDPAPTEALNLLIKTVKRAGHGFRNLHNHRLRILLHAGGGLGLPQPPAPSLRTPPGPR